MHMLNWNRGEMTQLRTLSLAAALALAGKGSVTCGCSAVTQSREILFTEI